MEARIIKRHLCMFKISSKKEVTRWLNRLIIRNYKLVKEGKKMAAAMESAGSRRESAGATCCAGFSRVNSRGEAVGGGLHEKEKTSLSSLILLHTGTHCQTMHGICRSIVYLSA